MRQGWPMVGDLSGMQQCVACAQEARITAMFCSAREQHVCYVRHALRCKSARMMVGVNMAVMLSWQPSQTSCCICCRQSADHAIACLTYGGGWGESTRIICRRYYLHRAMLLLAVCTMGVVTWHITCRPAALLTESQTVCKVHGTPCLHSEVV